jgi:glutathione synthase/RimK-type ligase-like ATP-grasp enzyme
VKIAFATCRKFPDLAADDLLAIPHLARLGIDVAPVCWEDGASGLGAFAGIVVRSTWNYVENHAAFMSWIEEIERLGLPLLNPARILRWNSDKGYLSELEKAGVPIVPTVFTPGLAKSRELARDRGWREAILKPAVSAGAARTFRLRPDDPSGWDECARDPATPGSGWLLQEFLPEVLSEGEHSFLFFDGKISHAVLKRPKPGDYRVQEQFGGRFEAVAASGAGLLAAEKVIEAGPKGSLYARVDLIRSGTRWLLGELEMLEPSLYLAHDPGAPERFARAIVKRLTP